MSKTHIVVLPFGWVVVGDYRESKTPEKTFFLDKAAVVRVWGTDKGLGQIAKNGPTKETILDALNGEVEVPQENVIMTIACNDSNWNKFLK